MQDLQPYGRQGLTALDYALENSYPDVVQVSACVVQVMPSVPPQVKQVDAPAS